MHYHVCRVHTYVSMTRCFESPALRIHCTDPWLLRGTHKTLKPCAVFSHALLVSENRLGHVSTLTTMPPEKAAASARTWQLVRAISFIMTG